MNQMSEVVQLLIADTEVITFEYSSEFVVGFQRRSAAIALDAKEILDVDRVPPMFNLRLRGPWWVGERWKWDELMKSFPYKAVSPIPPEAPLQASLLACALGCVVKSLLVGERGDLTIELSNDTRISISGTGSEWEESWFLELPINDPDCDKWSIVCDSAGQIAGYYPRKGGNAGSNLET